jgi:hypothetical protein
MAHQIVPLEDGSVLLCDDAPSASSPAPQGVLGGELTHFVVDAVAGGVTFDVLKRIASRLTASREPSAVPADDVRDAVTAYLLRSGYRNVNQTELRQVGEHGWTIEGTADGEPFHALSDPAGRVIHVQLG